MAPADTDLLPHTPDGDEDFGVLENDDVRSKR